MTWMKRLQCFFNVGWWHAMLKITLVYIEMEEGSGQSMDLAIDV